MERGKLGALANLAESSGASIVHLSCYNSEWNCYPLCFSFAWSPGEGSLGKGMTLSKAAISVEAEFEGGYLHYPLWLADMEKYSLPFTEGLAQVEVSKQPLSLLVFSFEKLMAGKGIFS